MYTINTCELSIVHVGMYVQKMKIYFHGLAESLPLLAVDDNDLKLVLELVRLLALEPNKKYYVFNYMYSKDLNNEAKLLLISYKCHLNCFFMLQIVSSTTLNIQINLHPFYKHSHFIYKTQLLLPSTCLTAMHHQAYPE